ncbi:uncharacterized protein PITG_02196 [Phytophthora infestans T30-4]|uniref:Uncharacterized protein n=1 Tax=Phytophthora infestans (strain T30-4) TaxID=403677 RepID=D0MVQ5_PHYIT|nr:uncharacterized protein PITG_02196 [Phytophthora infestans T30-4]EEY63718.1 conserved hypothetical protein [Phytophthora infestans T30-4]|eukprot:XP_002907154.1 conserved hypothetical protein [Phytophthora infestans T30-4]
MRTRIWEDAAAMSVVSVLGFIMNDEGEVVGSERTQVLCKLMPSIHTLSHRAILALLITQLSDADAQVFYAEGGLKVLNAWLVDGVTRRETGLSKEKKRTEMFSQVRAIVRILDVNVQTDAQRKQNSYLTATFAKIIELLDNAGPEYAAEWSRLNIYRRHFESSCGVPSTVKEGRNDSRRFTNSYANGNGSRNAKTPSENPPQHSFMSSTSSSTTSTTSASAPRKPPTSGSSSGSTSTPLSSTNTPSSHRVPPSSVLQYQPKSFLQKDNGSNNLDQDDLEEYVEDDDEEMLLADEGVITNVNHAALSASLEQKIRKNGHDMQYGERSPCRKCKRMASKRCTHCEFCAKCGQKDKCEPISVTPSSPGSDSSGTKTTGTGIGAKSLSVKDRNVQVLGSVMDAAIYHAFRQEDFHSVFSLIQNGMDVNFQRVESDHSSALMAAAHHGRDDAASKLLSLGANPCLEDHTGNKAWNFAERRGHTELMDKLKKCCDEWEAKHKDGEIKAQS